MYSWRVPRGTFGTIRIIPKVSIGDLAPPEGEPVIFHLSLMQAIAGEMSFGLIILLLIGGIVLENKRWAAMLGVIPLLIVSMAIFVAGQYAEIIGGIVIPLLFSVNTLILMAEELRGDSGMVTLLQVILLMLFTSAMGYMSWYGFHFTHLSASILSFTLTGILIISSGAAIVRLILGKRFTLPRFAVYHELFIFVAISIYYIIWVSTGPEQSHSPDNIPLLTTALFVVVPFIPAWVVYGSVPMFRERIMSLLHAPSGGPAG